MLVLEPAELDEFFVVIQSNRDLKKSFAIETALSAEKRVPCRRPQSKITAPVVIASEMLSRGFTPIIEDSSL